MHPDLRFYRDLCARIEALRETLVSNLVSGGLSLEPSEVALWYAKKSSYVQALDDILELCDQVERDIMGA